MSWGVGQKFVIPIIESTGESHLFDSVIYRKKL